MFSPLYKNRDLKIQETLSRPSKCKEVKNDRKQNNRRQK